jgi:hypothetical protein
MNQQSDSLAVGVFDTHELATDAVRELQRGGFDMTRLSILGRGYQTEEHVVGYFNAGDRARFFGKYGAFWGGLAGILFGAAFMIVPVLGHLIVLGPLASMLVSGVEGAAVAGGLSAVAGALSALGVPHDSALRYESALRAEKFLLVVHGDPELQQRARDILAARVKLEPAAA